MSHVGLCVSDLEWSLRFYTEGLDFKVALEIPIDGEAAKAAEMEPGVEGTAIYIENNGARLELLHYTQPGAQGTPSKVRNQLGLTHVCVEVDSIDETVKRLVALGGSVLESTRSRVVKPPQRIDLLVVADRDGNRIELLERGLIDA